MGIVWNTFLWFFHWSICCQAIVQLEPCSDVTEACKWRHSGYDITRVFIGCKWHLLMRANFWPSIAKKVRFWCTCVCMLCSCKKGMVDVKSFSKKCREVTISILNTTCFRYCTVLQQAKAFPYKRGILYNTYSGCLVSILQLQRIQMMFSAGQSKLGKFWRT